MLDRHARSVMTSVWDLGRQLSMLASSGETRANAAQLLSEAVEQLAGEVGQYPLFQTCEVVRLACLPWNIGGQVQPDTEDGVTLAELLVLVAATDPSDVPNPSSDDLNLFTEAKRWKKHAKDLVNLSLVEQFAALKDAGTASVLDKISLSMRGSEVWIRSSSYPDMLTATITALFEPPEIGEALQRNIGFTATEALTVLETCHDLQVEGWSTRMDANAAAFQELSDSGANRNDIDPDDPRLALIRRTWIEAWQATGDSVSVKPAAIADRSGLDVEVVQAVAGQFRLDIAGRTPKQIVRAFTAGDNPLRTNPLLVSENGNLMLVHSALNHRAVRENLEQILKADPPAWDKYQYHRGQLLERLTAEAFERLLPAADVYASFEYFVPIDDEQAAKEPSDYTRKVEGDLLFVLDDVAVIVEAKAVAINPRSRAGDTRRLRRDLIAIIKDASKQASRLAERIEVDGGVRMHKTGWLDLSHIREIHLAAVSLEDLVSVATATADLLAADLLDEARIPWTVSIHDLQIIGELIDTPAEFLLYLRRRRDREATMFYAAPDELDLFLFFYENGLYVAPDPDKVQDELPFIKPTTAARRHRRQLKRTFITSRTDALDQWHYSRLDPDRSDAPKPTLNGSPLVPFVRELQTRADYGWLSIGATLLSGSTKTQADLSRQAKGLLKNPDPLGRERSATLPIGSTRENAWLLVWITRPRDRTIEEATAHAVNYLRAKKYQLGLTRGVAFLFDEADRTLCAVLYNGDRPTPDPALDEQIKQLFPVEDLPNRPPPKARRR